MALKKQQYAAFEDVVGEKNISDDPSVLYSYAWRSGMLAGAYKFAPRFEAVLLPASTREVQSIVRLCNRMKLQYKATSTRWGAFNDPTSPGVIQLDLRRMNRILEINEKNMYAVVEPYVISAQLQAELMKRGLNCNMCGAGSNCSALPIAAHQGLGHMSQSASYGERNQLAIEWVTPDGEIVRMGSLGSSDQWFCGDGPGPSLRGVIRGNVAPLGGMGVFTAAATKIYHWAGPPVMPLEGISPHYAPKSYPENCYIGFYAFNSIDDLDKAQQLIGEAEIGFQLMGFNAPMASANIATSNEEDVKLMKEFSKYVKGRPCIMITMIGNSARDFDYKKKALKQAIEQTNGEFIPHIIDDPKVAAACIWRYARITGSIREVFRVSGVFGGEVGQTDVFRLMADYISVSGAKKQDLIDRDFAYDDGFSPFTQSFEHGHYGHGELLVRYMATPKASKAFFGDFARQANEIAVEQHFGVPGHVFGDDLHDMFGPHVSNYHQWMRKLKKSFDPNDSSEGSHYISNRKK